MYQYRKYNKGDSRETAVITKYHPPLCECGLCIITQNKDKKQFQDRQTESAIYSHRRPAKSNSKNKRRAKEDRKFQRAGQFFKILDKRHKELERIRQDVEQERDLQKSEDKTAFQQIDCCGCCCSCCEKEIQSSKPTSYEGEILPISTVGDSAAKPTCYPEEIFPSVTNTDGDFRPAQHIFPVVDNTTALPDHCHEVGTVAQRTYGILDCLAIIAIVDTAVHLSYYNENTVSDVTFDDTAIQSIFYNDYIPPAITVGHTSTQTTSSNEERVVDDDDAMCGILGVYSNRI